MPPPQIPRCRLAVKVAPKSSVDAVRGWLGDTLKVQVTAAPERGKANRAVLKVLARALDVPPRSLRLIAGESSARKIIDIEGLTEVEVRRRLARFLPS